MCLHHLGDRAPGAGRQEHLRELLSVSPSPGSLFVLRHLRELTEGAEFVSPFSLPVEVANAFSAMFKRKRVSVGKAKDAATACQQIAIRLTEIDLVQALDLSHRLEIYAYDAYLIACSLQYRAPLLTGDGGLRDAARRVKVDVLEVS